MAGRDTKEESIVLPKNRGRLFLPEFLEIMNEAKAVQTRVRLMREYAALGPEYENLLKIVGRALYHPDVKFALPPGVPPFKKSDGAYGMNADSLFKVIKVIGKWCECPSLIKSTPKREHYFIQKLESMHEKEALLLCMIKDRNIDSTVYKGLTKKLFLAAFPGLLPEDAPKTKESQAVKN